jgi:hypothetical protein
MPGKRDDKTLPPFKIEIALSVLMSERFAARVLPSAKWLKRGLVADQIAVNLQAFRGVSMNRETGLKQGFVDHFEHWPDRLHPASLPALWRKHPQGEKAQSTSVEFD